MSLIPNSGMAVSVDVGNSLTIHPPYKTTISKRLAYWALAKTYGKKGIVYHSPHYHSMEIKDNLVNLTFQNAQNGF
jgi:sialate O-acetylesterase